MNDIFDGNEENLDEGVEQSQSLNEEQDIPKTSSLDLTAEEIEAEEKLKEYYRKYFPSQKNGEDSGFNLVEQLDNADRMTLFLFQPPKIEDMNTEEQEVYQKKISRKMAFYDFGKNFGVNLYNWEAKRFLGKAKKQKDTLENQLNTFLGELKGGYHRDSNGEIYKDILEDMPNYMQQDPKFKILIGYLNEKATGSKNGKGLKDELRETKEEAVWLADLDDFLYGAMTNFDRKIEETTYKIRSLNERLAKDSKDKTVMQERARDTVFLNKYKEEKEKYTYVRDDILNKLDVIELELDSTQDKVAIREVAIAKTRRSLARLNAAISKIENYRQSKQDMVVITDHVLTMQQAHDYIKQAESVGHISSTFVGKAYDNLIKQESELGEIPYAKTNRRFEGMRDQMRTERDDRVENLKSRLRARAYN